MKMDKKSLLDLRQKIKAKKPRFSRQDSHKKKRLGNKWRRPKGIDSKMRLSLSGYRRSPSKGFRSPCLVRGQDRKGNDLVLVHNLSELKGQKAVTIAAAVSLRNKVAIVEECLEKGITISNIRKPSDFLEQVKQQMDKKKKQKEKKESEKKQKAKEKEKKAAELEKKKKEEEEKKKKEESKGQEKQAEKQPGSLEDLASEEEQKKKEKQDKDKVLTKKGTSY
jgi:large subunit ribosomal protein L32e